MPNFVPWEGIGVKLKGVTPDVIMREAGLDWTVEKCPLLVDGRELEVQDTVAVIRSDKPEVPVSYVSSNWELIQNEEGVATALKLARESGLRLTYGGVLANGRVVWLLAVPESGTYRVGSHDFYTGALFSVPHSYGQTMAVSPVHVRTGSRVTTFVDEKVMTFSHRKKLDPTGSQLLDVVARAQEGFKAKARKMVSGSFASAAVPEAFASRIFGVTSKGALSKPAQKVLEALKEEPARNNALDLFMATSFVIDNELGHSIATRLESAWFGVNRKKKARAAVLAETGS